MLGKKSKKTGDVLVKVGRIGTETKEYALNGVRTVEEALRVAGLSVKESEIVQVNGEEIDDMSHELSDGDRVILAKNVEGGSR